MHISGNVVLFSYPGLNLECDYNKYNASDEFLQGASVVELFNLKYTLVMYVNLHLM